MNQYTHPESPHARLSHAAKRQVQEMRRFRAHPSSHEHAVATIVKLIRSGDITQMDDARVFCAEEEWTEAEIASLGRTIDDVGFTLKAAGIIKSW